MSYFLKRAGIRHLALERSQIGESWRSQRWDSFSFNTPNAVTIMPGCTYAGPEPGGFMSHLAFVDMLEAFAKDEALPVIVHTPAISVSRQFASGPYMVKTPERTIVARSVVIASGSQNCLRCPPSPERFPPVSRKCTLLAIACHPRCRLEQCSWSAADPLAVRFPKS